MSTPPPAQTATPPRPEATPRSDAPNSRTSPNPDAPAPSPGPDASGSPRLDAPIPQPPPPPTAIVTAGREKHPCHQKGLPKVKPGKLPWVHGTKLLFFARRKDWLRESEANCSGAFYSKMSKLYVKKYGYHLADDQDLAEDVEDPPDEAADEVVHEVMLPEEQQFRVQYTKNLRTRIGVWYHAQYGLLLKSDKTAFQELFTGILDGMPPKPQRGHMLHFYSRKFYELHIKEDVEERMASLTRRAGLAGEAGPKHIDVIAKVTVECWDQETVEFQQDCELAMECEYQQALKHP
ncbi:hypothetical protein DFH08DRAFT_978973 [Mycena albidolilacea]|uniref:Uncharacterized protein n=1 Tax=Mycena albidolilacea TaxID=1033008 RepID=A0AAD6YXF4_9AGAR|nr:hypothetical protein DFH08DRAFT_978973 [Mycena albidolilacea]